MTTCNDVFDLAMGLIDEVDEDTINTKTVDTREYRARTPFIIETLLRELYFASDTFNDPEQTAGKRPMPVQNVIPSGTTLDRTNIETYMARTLDLDDFVARSILPYGLAAHLLLMEDPNSASFFQQRYEELLRWYRSSTPSEFDSVIDVYGIGNEHGEYAWW